MRPVGGLGRPSQLHGHQARVGRRDEVGFRHVEVPALGGNDAQRGHGFARGRVEPHAEARSCQRETAGGSLFEEFVLVFCVRECEGDVLGHVGSDGVGKVCDVDPGPNARLVLGEEVRGVCALQGDQGAGDLKERVG